jgi:uncharacterized protein YndB with AHSA1/START domain
MQGDRITVERLVPAPAEKIFALLADAARHPVIDGSGMVRQAKSGATEPLKLGSTFGMSMKMGIRYSMESEVIEFEPGRRIAWQSRPPGRMGKMSGGRVWRYELEPRDDGTLVRETWDISRDKQRRLLGLGGLPKRTREGMEKTLERIEELLADSS